MPQNSLNGPSRLLQPSQIPLAYRSRHIIKADVIITVLSGFKALIRFHYSLQVIA